MRHRKVIVFGKGEAGKSTFIRTVVPDAVNIAHGGRTVALDFGSVQVNGSILHLYGTPGQTRFEAVRDVLSHASHSAIMIFDTSRAMERDDHEIFGELKSLAIPFLAVANVKKGRPVVTELPEIQRLCGGSSHFLGLDHGDVSSRSFAQGILSRLQTLV